MTHLELPELWCYQLDKRQKLVQLFLDEKIKFLDIERSLKRVIKLREFNKYRDILPTNVNQIIKLNKYVRLKTQSLSVLSVKS